MSGPGAAAGARFAVLAGCPRIWAVASIHGEADRLRRLHDRLEARLAARDGLVYLGNLIGWGAATTATLDELLRFRRAFLARRWALVTDHVFLRGSQEEMWHKLRELQFAAAPRDVLDWMLAHGLEPVLAAYGTSAAEAAAACREGPKGLTRWTGRIRAAIRLAEGHDAMMTALKRAAYTRDGGLLFVNAGIDPSRPLAAQRDSFWWGGAGFMDLAAPFQNFTRVVRGYDRRHPGIAATPFAVTIDGGSGFGGSLLAACFDPAGTMLDSIEA